ncbi:MAG TPA: tetratricopeptide repeat protein [Candidatus Krumholzibacteria bacterium]|nr:tetratricopeptide repeat protein [Candidatus Krumholzibacteria bacterium]
MTSISHFAIRRRMHARGATGALAILAMCVALGGLVVQVHAQKSYRYEDDPIRGGNKALEDNRLDDAKAKFDEAIEAGYQLPKAKFGLGEVDARTGRFEEAEELYREALDLSKRSGEKSFPEAHAGLGILLIDSDRWDEGAQHIMEARKQNGGYWPGIYGEARLMIHEDKLDKAKSLLDYGGSRRGVGQGEDLYHRGLAMYYIAKNDLKAAETEALTALHLNPANPRHGKLVALVYEKRNVPALAINACEEVLRTPGFTPTASFVHYTGTLYQKAERYNEARDKYLEAVKLDSTYTPVLKDLAHLYAMADQYDQASKVYLRYVQLEPNDIMAKAGLAEALGESGRYKQALDTANEAMKADSTHWQVRLAYARAAIHSRSRADQSRAVAVYAALPDSAQLRAEDYTAIGAQQIETNQLDLARGNLHKAMAMDSTYAEAYFQRGLLSFKNQHPDSAVTYFRAAIRHDNKKPIYFLNLGVAHFQLKQVDKAAPAFRGALALDNKLVIGHVLLGQALVSEDSLAAATRAYNAALAIEPDNAKALRGLGFIHLRNAEYDEAATAYKSSTDSEPRNADGWAGLGQAYLGLRNLNEAEAAFRKAQAIDPNNATLKRGMETLNKARGG